MCKNYTKTTKLSGTSSDDTWEHDHISLGEVFKRKAPAYC